MIVCHYHWQSLMLRQQETTCWAVSDTKKPSLILKRQPKREEQTAKARCYYLLGQTYQLLQQPEQAYQSYSKVIRLNPPYELALSARIRQTEVMPTANSRKITGKLLRLSKDEKTKSIWIRFTMHWVMFTWPGKTRRRLFPHITKE